MNILGISAFYHDSAAALVRDGEIVAAAQEERFTRIKNDASFPANAICYCLAEGGVGKHDLDTVVFYDKPIVKFARLLETYISVAPHGLRSFMQAMPLWLREKLWTPYQVETRLAECGVDPDTQLLFTEHHESHAAAAFFPSPFESAAILTLDAVGEWATSTVGHGRGSGIELLSELRFPHSLGLLYSAFTAFLGFRVNSGEYKIMGLAPYGEPRFYDRIVEELVDLRDDGSFRLNMKYFGFLAGLKMTNDRFSALFEGTPRRPGAEVTRLDADLACSVQAVTEEIVLRMARYAHKQTGERFACMAGGVALNSVANGRLLQEGPFDDIWIQPAAGDAGGALGAALYVWHAVQGAERLPSGHGDTMQGAYLGPAFDDREIGAYLDARGYPAELLPDASWADVLAGLVADQKVVGLHQGRMEFGPRALGNRSIIADARSPQMQSVLNLKIKDRESFRPFAPSCLEECAGDFFELDHPSPYMLLVVPVRKERRCDSLPEVDDLLAQVVQQRSDIPAVTHVDFSARVHTVTAESNPRFHDLIRAFEKRTGYGVIINTSFNVRDEPIVCTPDDAYRCFMQTEMDCLVLGSYLLRKENQPKWIDNAEDS